MLRSAPMSGVQIARTALPANKPVYQALASIFGIGVARGLEISETCGISKGMRVRTSRSRTLLSRPNRPPAAPLVIHATA